MLANARMYSVTPECKAAWRTVLDWVLADSGMQARYEDHDPPKLLSDLWARDDLACVQMCGLPFSLRTPHATILAAPVPSLPRYGGKPIYWSDIAVRADSTFTTFEDTLGARAGYTLKDSQSGYFAFRYHLLRKFPSRLQPYSEITGKLLNPRGVIKALAEGRIDVGPLDSYVHDLLRRHEPETAAKLRVIESTAMTPIPLVVASPGVADDAAARLRNALLSCHAAPELAATLDTLLLARFTAVDVADYDVLLDRARAADLSLSARVGVPPP